jgi:hypothetical protein
VSEIHEDRIKRQEEYWNGPKLFLFGLVFVAAAVAFLYFIASIPVKG